MPAHRYVEEISLAAMLAGVAEMNVSEHVTCIPLPSMNTTPQRRRHQKSKTGVLVAPQKDLCPPPIFKKYTNNIIL